MKTHFTTNYAMKSEIGNNEEEAAPKGSFALELMDCNSIPSENFKHNSLKIMGR